LGPLAADGIACRHAGNPLVIDQFHALAQGAAAAEAIPFPADQLDHVPGLRALTDRTQYVGKAIFQADVVFQHHHGGSPTGEQLLPQPDVACVAALLAVHQAGVELVLVEFG